MISYNGDRETMGKTSKPLETYPVSINCLSSRGRFPPLTVSVAAAPAESSGSSGTCSLS